MMVLTSKQHEALDLLVREQNVLLYGGARSGKTALAIYFCLFCALEFPGIRILVARRYAIDIRGAVWNDTLAKAARTAGRPSTARS
jgi:predicted ribonuclease YlaK